MALIDCPYCNGDGKSRMAVVDDGTPVICEWCGGKGKMGAITIDEGKNKRYNILKRKSDWRE